MGVAWGFKNYRPTAPRLAIKEKNMKLTNDQIEALRQFGDWAEQLADKLEAGEAVTVEREVEREVKRWEPEGGDFFVGSKGNASGPSPSSNIFRRHGCERSTLEAAERLANDQRIFNRLHAYREEFAPGYVVPDHGEVTWCVAINGEMTWYLMPLQSARCPTDVYMPEDVARELCRKLNSGEVVL